MAKTLSYTSATLEQLRDWQETGDDKDTLEFDSFGQMTEHLWEDYSILKKKKKDRAKAKRIEDQTQQDLPDVPEGTKVYKFASMTAKFKRNSLVIE